MPRRGRKSDVEGNPTEFGSTYHLLSGAVVPRPIAWVSTRGSDGADNLAPFSFFNVVAVDPPVVMFVLFGAGEDQKDTAWNVLDTEEFVVHVVTMDVAKAMNDTSATLPPGKSEFVHADLDAVEGMHVDVACVVDAKVAFECRLYDSLTIGNATMVLGEVMYAHVDERIVVDEKFDVREFEAVGRLAGSYYASTHDRFRMERPP